MSVLVTFLGNCRGGIQDTASRLLADRGCGAVLTAMQLPTPSLLRSKCPILFSPLYDVDVDVIIKTLFGMPKGTIMAVYR
jgi:hypothetical protein